MPSREELPRGASRTEGRDIKLMVCVYSINMEENKSVDTIKPLRFVYDFTNPTIC